MHSEIVSHETEVLIVGAGPTGLALGCRLAREGVACMVVDQAEQGANTSRAAVIHARTLEVLERIGVTDDLVREGVIVPHFSIRDRDEKLLELDFARLPTRYPYALMLPQDRTEGILAERLVSYGTRVHRPLRLEALEQNARGVTITLVEAGAHEGREPVRHSVWARYVVGCDGMHSAVREAARILFIGSPYDESFVLADVHMDWPFPRDEVELFLSRHGLVVVAPLPQERYRIVATVPDAPEHPDLQGIQTLLDQRGPKSAPGRIHDVVWSSRFRVHRRLAQRYRNRRVFVAGDAAHVHSPAGGQGMNTGIQDAMNLSDKLALALRQPAQAAVLDSYEFERRPVAASVVKLTDRLTRLATLRPGLRTALRNRALRWFGRVPAFRQKLAMDLSELSS